MNKFVLSIEIPEPETFSVLLGLLKILTTSAVGGPYLDFMDEAVPVALIQLGRALRVNTFHVRHNLNKMQQVEYLQALWLQAFQEIGLAEDGLLEAKK